MRTLTNENDQLKQHSHQLDRSMNQLKKDNEELQQKVNFYPHEFFREKKKQICNSFCMKSTEN